MKDFGVFIGFSLAALVAVASLASPEKEVAGSVTIDGKSFALEHAYVDETDATEPIVVLSDKPLPAGAIPFLSPKLVTEKQIHAVAFSVSRQDKTITNNFGKVYCPGHELGFGRVEDGRTTLTITRLDPAAIEGRFATKKPVTLSETTYAFDVTFRAKAGQRKS